MVYLLNRPLCPPQKSIFFGLPLGETLGLAGRLSMRPVLLAEADEYGRQGAIPSL